MCWMLYFLFVLVIMPIFTLIFLFLFVSSLYILKFSKSLLMNLLEYNILNYLTADLFLFTFIDESSFKYYGDINKI